MHACNALQAWATYDIGASAVCSPAAHPPADLHLLMSQVHALQHLIQPAFEAEQLQSPETRLLSGLTEIGTPLSSSSVPRIANLVYLAHTLS